MNMFIDWICGAKIMQQLFWAFSLHRGNKPCQNPLCNGNDSWVRLLIQTFADWSQSQRSRWSWRSRRQNMGILAVSAAEPLRWLWCWKILSSSPFRRRHIHRELHQYHRGGFQDPDFGPGFQNRETTDLGHGWAGPIPATACKFCQSFAFLHVLEKWFWNNLAGTVSHHHQQLLQGCPWHHRRVWCHRQGSWQTIW